MTESFIAEYIWLDAGGNLRSKSRTITFSNWENVFNATEYKSWNFDGSSTGDAEGCDSEIIIDPVAVYKDPFRGGNHKLVLCETYLPNGEKTPANKRREADNIFNKYKDSKPWYGLEQEFFIMDSNKLNNRSHTTTTPYGTVEGQLDSENPQGQYYCSVGHQNAFGREIAEEAYTLSLKAGLKCSGMNAEVAPGQWEIQVGPCEGISAADELTMLRYILHRVSENHCVQISLHPKPITGDWNGSGCHTNFSTEEMREKGGYSKIIEAIEKLGTKHTEHMAVYGRDNELRCSGMHETASYTKFSYGVADRGSSIRIPREAEKNQCGYFEDRRPASNMDPYIVTSKILETVMG